MNMQTNIQPEAYELLTGMHMEDAHHQIEEWLSADVEPDVANVIRAVMSVREELETLRDKECDDTAEDQMVVVQRWLGVLATKVRELNAYADWEEQRLRDLRENAFYSDGRDDLPY